MLLLHIVLPSTILGPSSTGWRTFRSWGGKDSGTEDSGNGVRTGPFSLLVKPRRLV